jgi:hypothetical protein
VDQVTLDGCTAKVDRAEIHVQAFTDEWRIFRESNPYPSWVEIDKETGWHHVWFDFSTPAPQTLPVIVGEYAHDLRSALDHLAWREAVERIGLGIGSTAKTSTAPCRPPPSPCFSNWGCPRTSWSAPPDSPSSTGIWPERFPTDA